MGCGSNGPRPLLELPMSEKMERRMLSCKATDFADLETIDQEDVSSEMETDSDGQGILPLATLLTAPVTAPSVMVKVWVMAAVLELRGTMAVATTVLSVGWGSEQDGLGRVDV